jgi:multidrug efflux pump subunit AcrA (membrane-fusion protein)
VEITLDALSDVTLEGTVSKIAPAGTVSSGVVNYPVTVALTKSADGVKTGMTANLEIVTDERQNVLTVPNKALKTVPSGKQKVVTLLRNGQQVQVPVQVGMASDTATEITGGLNEGDVVVVSGATTTSTTTGGGIGGPVMGGGGPPPGM